LYNKGNKGKVSFAAVVVVFSEIIPTIVGLECCLMSKNNFLNLQKQ